jgi:hypothetical protein
MPGRHTPAVAWVGNLRREEADAAIAGGARGSTFNASSIQELIDGISKKRQDRVRIAARLAWSVPYAETCSLPASIHAIAVRMLGVTICSVQNVALSGDPFSTMSWA